MNKYTIFCTPEQTKRALELGAPIIILPFTSVMSQVACDKYGFLYVNNKCYQIPTAEQMILWLEEQISYIDVIKQENNTWLYIFYPDNNSNKNITVKGFSSREEATLAAIDAALEYLSKKI